ncbi:MAG: hypothetical protein ACRDPE_07045 [Solirubrobacterales bacterium]
MAEVGPEVTDFAVGDRVGMGCICNSCGEWTAAEVVVAVVKVGVADTGAVERDADVGRTQLAPLDGDGFEGGAGGGNYRAGVLVMRST